ncbi:MAG TPA: hypothetical protein PKG96_10700 [Bacilli bacterium]|jgi:hypothetical protein|nr:hypothetical protein [Bacilli bacterium]
MDKHFRLIKIKRNYSLQIETIKWITSYNPKSIWKTVYISDSEISADILNTLIELFIKDIRFFFICKVCNKKQLKGYEIEEKLCSTCAEKKGYVF